MVSELTELNRNMMLSIDIVPIPDEAVREVENNLLGGDEYNELAKKAKSNNNFGGCTMIWSFSVKKARSFE